MNPIMRLFKEFERRPVRRNPPAPAGEDDISEFLRHLSGTNQLEDWSEDQWIEFGRREDMSDREIVELIEQAAGWVQDTTDNGRRPPEPAAWTRTS